MQHCRASARGVTQTSQCCTAPAQARLCTACQQMVTQSQALFCSLLYAADSCWLAGSQLTASVHACYLTACSRDKLLAAARAIFLVGSHAAVKHQQIVSKPVEILYHMPCSLCHVLKDDTDSLNKVSCLYAQYGMLNPAWESHTVSQKGIKSSSKFFRFEAEMVQSCL